MKLHKLYCKVFKLSNSDKGFTLIELLLAASLTTIVVGVAGAGLVAIMTQNQKASAETSGRETLNRALDYISNDIRSAQSISPATGYTITPSSTCATATPIFILTIPIITNPPTIPTPTKTVLYYLNDISGCTGSTGVWLKPSTIQRVDNVSSTTIVGGSPNDLLLVDGISNATVSPTPTCPVTSQLTPSTPKGFYACINTTVTSAGFAQVTLIGQLPNSSTLYQLTVNTFNRSFR